MKIAYILLFVLLSANIAYAAGTSTGWTPPPKQIVNSTPPNSTITPLVQEKPDCESMPMMNARVQCRLEQKTGSHVVEESCRGLPDSKSCQILYDKVQPCYKIAGREKDQCLKQTAGFSKMSVGQEQDKTAVRKYLVFLLYDLQDKVEEKYNNGELSAEKSAGIIAAIVVAKQTILQGKSVADTKAAIAVVKQKWRENI